MRTRKAPRLTRLRLGIAASIGLVVFGVVDASLPSPAEVNPAVSGFGPRTSPNTHLATAGTTTAPATPVRSLEVTAAQRVAEEFVAAMDTTDPARPEGDTAERAVLAPGLTVPRRLAWPEAWVAEARRTTVTLDLPGPVVMSGTAEAHVVVTGRTVVTSDAGPSEEVPINERITLRLIGQTGTASPNDAASPDDTVHWVVTNVGTGS